MPEKITYTREKMVDIIAQIQRSVCEGSFTMLDAGNIISCVIINGISENCFGLDSADARNDLMAEATAKNITQALSRGISEAFRIRPKDEAQPKDKETAQALAALLKKLKEAAERKDFDA
ncbi:hypothetical protein [Faecalibaculum rodentium]|uniref:hypothetical protein n=1 Tax=Faecalibaculum rodentium TaxID=1702221 RepID=UPI0025B793E6|nr:hypothetical protein [Faecalibaculum rodentium]